MMIDWLPLPGRFVNPRDEREYQAVKALMQRHSLSLTEQFDDIFGIYDQNKLIAAGILDRNVLRNIAVDEEYQSQDLTSRIVTALISRAAGYGINHLFLFTKPEHKTKFTAFGFKPVVEINNAVLLETGGDSVRRYCDGLRAKAASLPPGKRACIVLNANPFTLGHQYLIERTAKENNVVIVFVVQANESVFPFAVRYDLVRKGTMHLKNVYVMPSGQYIISAATFPDYFIKRAERASTQAELDIRLFVKYIAPSLSIHSRYTGSEPQDPTTSIYNEKMKAILPLFNINFKEIPRITRDGEIISASKVRALIKENRPDEVKKYVPQTTYDYLYSADAAEVMERIKCGQKTP